MNNELFNKQNYRDDDLLAHTNFIDYTRLPLCRNKTIIP